jgi:hypothetical protein
MASAVPDARAMYNIARDIGCAAAMFSCSCGSSRHRGRKLTSLLHCMYTLLYMVLQCSGDEEFLRELLVDLWTESADHLEELMASVPAKQISVSAIAQS